MAAIELCNVSRHFPGTSAVSHVSFTIRDGEFFILVGPSGCGKSTLLNMIVGLESVSEGEIRVDGQVVNDLDPRDRNMAMVFQSYALYPHMSVRENLAFPLRLARLPKQEIERRVRSAAGILGLGALLDRKPRDLSGGQRQRVAMGRAIVREPRAFLLDEPLSNLDAQLRVQMRTELARLQRRLGTTTVYVTHDQTEAMTLGDRVAVMHRGEVLQIGTPRALYECPANLQVAAFIGAPAMNFLPARGTRGRLALPVGTLAFPAGTHGSVPDDGDRALVAGIRPEHFRLVRHGDEGPGVLSFDVQAEVVEWLGAELFVYFELPLEGFAPPALPEAAGPRHAGETRHSLVARLDPASGVREGDTIRLQLDPGQIHLFGADNGVNLMPSDEKRDTRNNDG